MHFWTRGGENVFAGNCLHFISVVRCKQKQECTFSFRWKDIHKYIYIYCTNLQHTGRRDKPRRLSDLLRFSSARARWETSDFAGETAWSSTCSINITAETPAGALCAPYRVLEYAERKSTPTHREATSRREEWRSDIDFDSYLYFKREFVGLSEL